MNLPDRIRLLEEESAAWRTRYEEQAQVLLLVQQQSNARANDLVEAQAREEKLTKALDFYVAIAQDMRETLNKLMDEIHRMKSPPPHPGVF